MKGDGGGAAPPWLERQLEVQRLVETVAKLKRIHVYRSEEIVRIVGERYRRLRPRRPGRRGRIEYELKRLETVFNVVYSRLRKSAEMPPSSSMSEFHRALLDAFIGSGVYEESRRRVRRALRLVREFWNQYRWLIATAESPAEAARLRREASGRILSVVRRLRRDLEVLSRVREELIRTHVVSEGLPIVVVAGIPSAGKSTLVSALSTAEPEVAAYPFTTKTVIVGKARVGDVLFYLVDTPGILERPPEHQNEIERRALAALWTLPDLVLYLFDPSPGRVQDVDEQLNLLRSIVDGLRSAGREVPLVVAINKMDDAEPSAAKRILEGLERLKAEGIVADECPGPVLISALKGQGLEGLAGILADCVKRTAPWIFEKKLTLTRHA